MLVVARDRWGKVNRVHYLPNGIPLRAGSPHHRPHIVLTEDRSFSNPIILRRDGDSVYVHLPNQVITVERGGSLNLTHVILEFVPVLERVPEIEEMWRLENDLFNPKISERVRKFIRLYLAYMGLRVSDRVPESIRESVYLLASRMVNEPVEKIVSEKKRLLKRIEGEIREVLSTMNPEEIMHVFEIVSG